MVDRTMKKLVVIASSTGGPKALHNLIPMLPKNLDAPVVIVQHMPKGFTASLAERINETSDISVSEVKDGEILQKGHVYLAQGGKHLQIVKNMDGMLAFRETDAEPVNGLRPCANVTLESLVPLSIERLICVVLTGMGADGFVGIKKLKEKQSIYTIAQSEESCVVYGMPKAIVENGIADIVLPLEEISEAITKKTGVF